MGGFEEGAPASPVRKVQNPRAHPVPVPVLYNPSLPSSPPSPQTVPLQVTPRADFRAPPRDSPVAKVGPKVKTEPGAPSLKHRDLEPGGDPTVARSRVHTVPAGNECRPSPSPSGLCRSLPHLFLGEKCPKFLIPCPRAPQPSFSPPHSPGTYLFPSSSISQSFLFFLKASRFSFPKAFPS